MEGLCLHYLLRKPTIQNFEFQDSPQPASPLEPEMAKDTKSKPGTPAKPKSAGGAAQSGIPEATAVPSNATPAAAPKPGTAPKPAAKKGGKGKEKAAPPPPVPFEEHQRLLDEQLSKLKELQTAFDGLQASSSKDAAEANEREEKLKSQLAEREEIIGHLEKRTREQGDRIAELKESTVRMQADVAATLADGQKKLSEEEQRVQGAIADVRAEMEGMRNQLDELEQFRLRKADLERELDEMKATLEKKKHEFREGLRDMEVKSLRDKVGETGCRSGRKF